MPTQCLYGHTTDNLRADDVGWAEPVSDADGTAVEPTGSELTAALLRRAADAPAEQRRALLAEVVESHLGLADSLARGYAHRGEDEQDLVQVARVGLVEAAQRFDPERGSFVAFAIPTMTGHIKRHFRDHGWTIRPPRRLQDLQAQTNRAWVELCQVLGHAPRAQEIADYLEQPAADVSEAQLAGSCYQLASLDAPAPGRGDHAVPTRAGAVDEFALVDGLVSLRPLYRALSADQRRIIHLRFVEGRTQQEIATELKVSQMHICRLLDRTLRELRDQLDGDDEASAAGQVGARRAGAPARRVAA